MLADQVAPEYFSTLDIRPIAGRLLETTDRRDAAGVAVVNQMYARTYLDGTNPIGRHIALPGGASWRLGGLAFQLGERLVDEVEIVGVIPDIKQGSLQDGVQPAVYIPQEQWIMRKMAIVVRAETNDPAALVPMIRRELAALDPTIPAVFAVYSDVVAASLTRHRLGAVVLVLFGLVSLTSPRSGRTASSRSPSISGSARSRSGRRSAPSARTC